MNPYSIGVSLLIGAVTGMLYGFSFLGKGLKLPNRKETNPKILRRRRFFYFFLFASLRIILIGSLWYYILRTQSVSIILVLLSFLASFWVVIIKRKARQYERF